MSVEVETKDSAALTEAELEALVLMGGSFDAPRLLQAQAAASMIYSSARRHTGEI